MSFNFGKPILAMLFLAVGSGALIHWRSEAPPANLTVWVFHESHARAYRSVVDEFTRETGLTVDVKLIASRALNVRLESIFMTGVGDESIPDLVEIEISDVGKYFRPPMREIGFAPLNHLLRQGGYDQKVIASRFAPWSKDGIVFGVPHDVHPVSLVFRDDLFREVDIDLASARTWPQFQDMCLLFQQRWQSKNPVQFVHRHALELHETNPDQLIMMLLQRHINLIDDFGRIHIDDPKVAQTIAIYAQMVSGPRRIAAESSPAGNDWVQDLLDGNICAMLTPDWRVPEIEEFVPSLAGKFRMMPLPVFEAGDAPTSTWGGTMMGIPKVGKHQSDAWRLLQFLYFSKQGLDAQRQFTAVLPAIKSDWTNPLNLLPDPFFRDENGAPQRVGELYVRLAKQIPPRYVTPSTAIAQMQLSFILAAANRHLRTSGPAGLEEECQHWLHLAAEDLQRRIKHGKFE